MLTNQLSLRFLSQIAKEIETENQLLAQELKIKMDPMRSLENKIAFVPDHLAFGCQEGVNIFKVRVFPLQSLIAIRSP